MEEPKSSLPLCSGCGNVFKENDRARVETSGGLVHLGCIERVHRPRDNKFWGELSHVLAYEITEFGRLMYRVGHPLLRGDLDHNARVEALLIHIRNIHDFLFLGSRADSSRDLVAEDFFDRASDWTDERTGGGSEFALAHDKASKLVGHMTVERLDLTTGEKLIDYNAVQQALNGSLRQLVEHAPRNRLSGDLKSVLGL